MITHVKTISGKHFKRDIADLSASFFFHGSARPNAKLLFLVTDRKTPLCILKVMRESQYNALLESECAGQKSTQGSVHPFRVPEVYFTDQIGEHVCYAEEVAPGVPVGKENALKYLETVLQFQNNIPKEKDIELTDLRVLFSATKYNQEKFQSFLKQLADMKGAVSGGWSHGDMTYMNLIDGKKGVYIIDWERYGERPIWGIDFVHYFIRCFDVQNLTEFKKRINGCGFVSSDEKIYFEKIYVIDALFDILQKQCSEKYRELIKRLSHV